MRKLVLYLLMIALFPVLASSNETSYNEIAKRGVFLYTKVIISSYDSMFFIDDTEKWFHCGNIIVYQVDIAVTRGEKQDTKVVFCEYEKDSNRYKVVVTDGKNPFICGGTN